MNKNNPVVELKLPVIPDIELSATKTAEVIAKHMNLSEEKTELIKMLGEEEKDDAEYKYIEIVVGTEDKLVDFTTIEKFVSLTEYPRNFGDEISPYIVSQVSGMETSIPSLPEEPKIVAIGSLLVYS